MHCIHRNVRPSTEPKLSPDQIEDLIRQSQALGVKFVNIYPHQGDLTPEPIGPFLEYLQYARTIGLDTKTVTSGANPRGLERFLPYISRLALSVDALDKTTYIKLRTPENYPGMLATLGLLQDYRLSGGKIYLSALVIVNRQTLNSIEQRVADIAALDLFDKIKILEMLPIGGARKLKKQALLRKSDLDRLAKIKVRFAQQGLRVGVPLWRIESDHRGCQLGSKDLVIGPHGELAGCTLLFYLNHLSGNIQSTSLADAWQSNFAGFRLKEQRQVAEVCSTCPFFQANQCWGGCLARGLIFGQSMEVKRGCGVRTPAEARQLYQDYLLASQADARYFYTEAQASR